MKRSLRLMVFLSTALAIALVAIGCQSPAQQAAPTQPPAKQAAPAPATSQPAAAQPAATQPPAKPAAASWSPSRPIELVCAFAAGGGTGITAETINKIVTDGKLSPQPINIAYKPGANGQLGWTYLAGKKGEPHSFGLITLGFVTGPLLTDSPLKLEDFTPIALLALDELMLVTSPNTPFKTVKDIVDAAKKSPKSIKVATVGSAGNDSTVIAMLEQAAGIKFNLIPFNAGSEVNAAVLGGQVELATMNPNEVSSTIEAGKLRPVAFFGDKRMAGYKDLPTVKESGYDVQLYNPRGIVAPAGIDKAAEQWYIDLMKKVVETKAWQDYASSNMMTSKALFGADFGKYLTDTRTQLTEVYDKMGLLKKK